MLKKRLIGVITVLDGWAVQSFGYNKYLPIGRPDVIAKNLDNWGADEIFIQSIDRSINNYGPDFKLLNSIMDLSLATPLTYGGGITSLDNAVEVIKNGFERIVVDSILHSEGNNLEEICYKIGSQAIVGSVPVKVEENKIYWFDYKNCKLKGDFNNLKNIINKKMISEIFLIDQENEGYQNSFKRKIYELFPFSNIPLILFGGLTNKEEIKLFLNCNNVSAVAIGNSLNYKEHSIQHYKESLINYNIRTAYYNT